MVERVRFTRRAYRAAGETLGERLRQDLVDHLTEHPDAGDLMPGSAGARKLRWRIPGRGKQGGARVLHVRRGGDVWVFAVYAKNEWESPPDWLLKLWQRETGN